MWAGKGYKPTVVLVLPWLGCSLASPLTRPHLIPQGSSLCPHQGSLRANSVSLVLLTESRDVFESLQEALLAPSPQFDLYSLGRSRGRRESVRHTQSSLLSSDAILWTQSSAHYSSCFICPETKKVNPLGKKRMNERSPRLTAVSEHALPVRSNSYTVMW